MTRLAPIVMLALALASCRHKPSDDDARWHRHAITECGFSVELPG